MASVVMMTVDFDDKPGVWEVDIESVASLYL